MVEKDATNETSNIIFGLNQNVITKFNSVLKIKKKNVIDLFTRRK